MRVAVTGAAGRVGRRLTAWLTGAGHDVVAIDVAPVEPAERVRAVMADLGDPAALRAATDGAEVVVHLAAAMSWRSEDDDLLRRVNVDGTWNVLAAARANRVRRFVFASSGEVYPDSKARFLPIDEHHPLEPTSVYGLTKLIGEELVRHAGRQAGIETVIIRLPHTQEAAELLDPESGFSGPRFFLRRRIEQQRDLGNTAAVKALKAALIDDELALLVARGEDGTSFRMAISDARDTAQGLGLAATVEGIAGETIGIGPDEAPPMDQLVPAMAKATGLPYVEVRLPGPAVHYHTSNAKARELLGFVPQWPIAEMIKEAAARWHSVRVDGDA